MCPFCMEVLRLWAQYNLNIHSGLLVSVSTRSPISPVPRWSPEADFHLQPTPQGCRQSVTDSPPGHASLYLCLAPSHCLPPASSQAPEDLSFHLFGQYNVAYPLRFSCFCYFLFLFSESGDPPFCPEGTFSSCLLCSRQRQRLCRLHLLPHWWWVPTRLGPARPTSTVLLPLQATGELPHLCLRGLQLTMDSGPSRAGCWLPRGKRQIQALHNSSELHEHQDESSPYSDGWT